MEHILLEKKDLGNDCLIAVPEQKYGLGTYNDYDHAGNLDNISTADFNKHDHWGFYFSKLEVLGSLQTPSKKNVESLRDKLLSLDKCGLDGSRLSNNEDILGAILDYERIKGDLYVLKFRGTYENKEFNLSDFILVNPAEGDPILNKHAEKNGTILFDGVNYKIDEGNMSFISNSNEFKGVLELVKAGSVELHRKALKAYTSRGAYGSPHENGPWIIYPKKD